MQSNLCVSAHSVPSLPGLRASGLWPLGPSSKS